jgi:DNA repair protein RadC
MRASHIISATANFLPDYELLELILFRASPRRDTRPLAEGDACPVRRDGDAPDGLLAEVPGFGEAAITELKLCARPRSG